MTGYPKVIVSETPPCATVPAAAAVDNPTPTSAQADRTQGAIAGSASAGQAVVPACPQLLSLDIDCLVVVLPAPMQSRLGATCEIIVDTAHLELRGKHPAPAELSTDRERVMP